MFGINPEVIMTDFFRQVETKNGKPPLAAPLSPQPPARQQAASSSPPVTTTPPANLFKVAPLGR
jgi:hypothetical protein